MRKRNILISIVLLLILAISVFSYYIGSQVFKNTIDLDMRSGKENAEYYFNNIDFNLENFESEYDIKCLNIESSKGDHKIPANYIINKDNGEYSDTIVMIHGLGGSKWTNYPMAEFFLRNGYNVLTYDQRSSGENQAEYITYGYLESKDLEDYISYLRENLGLEKKIGILGFSMGGETAGIYLGSNHANENIDFAILDSALSDMRYLVSNQMKKMDLGLPIEYMMTMGSFVSRIKLGFSFSDLDICNYINRTEVPILIAHSESDIITPYFMAEDIYKAIKSDKKKIYTVKDSQHINIFHDHREEYEKEIIEFIKEYVPNS